MCPCEITWEGQLSFLTLTVPDEEGPLLVAFSQEHLLCIQPFGLREIPSANDKQGHTYIFQTKTWHCLQKQKSKVVTGIFSLQKGQAVFSSVHLPSLYSWFCSSLWTEFLHAEGKSLRIGTFKSEAMVFIWKEIVLSLEESSCLKWKMSSIFPVYSSSICSVLSNGMECKIGCRWIWIVRQRIWFTGPFTFTNPTCGHERSVMFVRTRSQIQMSG